MGIYFSKVIDRYFLRWIAPDTLFTYHPLDMERFYQFVKAIQKYSRSEYGPKLRKNIIKATKKEHPDFSDDIIKEKANDFSSLAHKILEYEAVGFPVHYVEMRNPHAVSLYLSRLQVQDKEGELRPCYSEAEIEKILVLTGEKVRFEKV